MWYRNGTCTHADPNNWWQRPAAQELLVGRKNVIKSNLLFEHFLLAYVIQSVSVPLTRMFTECLSEPVFAVSARSAHVPPLNERCNKRRIAGEVALQSVPSIIMSRITAFVCCSNSHTSCPGQDYSV